MKGNKEYNYFQMFIESAGYSEQAIVFLKDTIDHYSQEDLPERIQQMHKIEQTADTAKHQMQSALAKAFITPIEREDILLLAQLLDDVTDAIEDVLQRLYMYHVAELRDDIKHFIKVIANCCYALKRVMNELSQFKKMKYAMADSQLSEMIIEVNRLEEDGDQIYLDAMRNLYLTESQVLKIVIWSEIYERLEKCCDACERVANQVDSIIMKNS